MRILSVDDEPVNQEVLRSIFEDDEDGIFVIDEVYRENGGRVHQAFLGRGYGR